MKRISEKPQPAHTQPATTAPVAADPAARTTDPRVRVPAGRSGQMVPVYYAFITNAAGRVRYISRCGIPSYAADCDLMTSADRFTEEELLQVAKHFEDVGSRYCCHVEVQS
jgi:hypothetical protein